MKGAALTIHPGLTLVDITHLVPPHDVLAGALHLKMAYQAFPKGTIHIAVVDPGVGTARRRIAVRTPSYYFVAPDNGILSLVLEEEPPGEARVLEAPHLRRPAISATFEGRDVFAPAAAWIARGLPLERFGQPAGELERLDLPRVELRPGHPVPARVLVVDRFGNVTLGIPRTAVEEATGVAMPRLRVETPRGAVEHLRRTYAESEPEVPFLLFNSAGYLEVAIREGRASDRLGLRPGDMVAVTLEP